MFDTDGSDRTFNVSYNSGVNMNFVNRSYAFRPAIYLTSNVGISSGDGTKNNAYVIK